MRDSSGSGKCPKKGDGAYRSSEDVGGLHWELLKRSSRALS